MGTITYKALLAWLLGALVVIATTLTVTANKPIRQPLPSSGVATLPMPMGVVKGIVRYQDFAVMTANAIVAVQLLSLSQSGASAAVLGEQTMQAVDGEPLAFEIRYDLAAIDRDGLYVIAATSTVDGELAFRASAKCDLLTQDGAPVAEVVLAKVGPRSPLDSALGSGRLARYSY